MTATTMRWLILPDIHDKLRRATQIIEREPHDRLLLMGDFFDDFRTGVTDAADTANQVKQWLNSPNTTCLLGNHDMSYGGCRQNRRLICPGYDAAKWIAINATMTNRDWQNFKLHAWLESGKGPWLVSHAGIHPVWLAQSRAGIGSSLTVPARTPGHVSTGANTTSCWAGASAALVTNVSGVFAGWIGMS